MTDKLPPLPDYDVMCDCGGNYYEPATVRSLIAAARAQALEDAAREVDKAIGEAIAGHFNKQAISALMQTRDMLKDRAMKGTP